MENYSNRQRGIVSEIILILVALIALKFFFNFDIVAYLKGPTPQKVIQESFNYLKEIYMWLHDTILHLIGKK